MPTKSTQRQLITYPPQHDPTMQSQFPSVRYFQVHFEYLESQINETKQMSAKLQQQLAELQDRLAFLLPGLNEAIGKK